MEACFVVPLRGFAKDSSRLECRAVGGVCGFGEHVNVATQQGAATVQRHARHIKVDHRVPYIYTSHVAHVKDAFLRRPGCFPTAAAWFTTVVREQCASIAIHDTPWRGVCRTAVPSTHVSSSARLRYYSVEVSGESKADPMHVISHPRQTALRAEVPQAAELRHRCLQLSRQHAACGLVTLGA